MTPLLGLHEVHVREQLKRPCRDLVPAAVVCARVSDHLIALLVEEGIGTDSEDVADLHQRRDVDVPLSRFDPREVALAHSDRVGNVLKAITARLALRTDAPPNRLPK